MLTASVALVAMMFGAAAPERVDVAFEELEAGKNQAAINELQSNDGVDSNDPSLLINLGAAHAREGNVERARALFRAALYAEDRQLLETADGEWVDSRVLARKALASLSPSKAATTTRVAQVER